MGIYLLTETADSFMYEICILVIYIMSRRHCKRCSIKCVIFCTCGYFRSMLRSTTFTIYKNRTSSGDKL